MRKKPIKTCWRCGGFGPFNRDASRGDGYAANCRKCQNESGRALMKTPAGKAKRAWIAILNRANNRDGKSPAYANVECRITREEFLAWAIPAFQKWIAENPDELGSVDRIDVEGHYELSNLRVISRRENGRLNRIHKNVHAPTGMAWCGKCKDYLPIQNFHRDSNKFNGVRRLCRQCVKARDAIRWRSKSKAA